MTDETRAITVEREFPHKTDRVWRALTQPALIAEWLMKTDFAPEIGRAFTLTGEWGSVNSEVREIEQGRKLSYTWNAMGLETVVTWTLTPTERGTMLRMDQTGFRKDQGMAYGGAKMGWPALLDKLSATLDGMDKEGHSDA